MSGWHVGQTLYRIEWYAPDRRRCSYVTTEYVVDRLTPKGAWISKTMSYFGNDRSHAWTPIGDPVWRAQSGRFAQESLDDAMKDLRRRTAASQRILEERTRTAHMR